MLCSIPPPNFPQTLLVNLTLAPSVGYHLKLDPQTELCMVEHDNSI